MKVTLRNNYSWHQVVVDAQEAKGYNEEFVIELPYKDVLEILRVQVEMEQLQQRLTPLFEAANERARAKNEAKKEAEELARFEAEGENLPV